MLEEMCAHIHNFFDRGRDGKPWHCESGEITISGGTIECPYLVPGQYFRVVGSRMNDGVYQYPAQDLADEVFDGEIYEMRVPPEFIRLANEIDAWQEKYAEAMTSPYQSESFGGYSYTKASGTSGTGSANDSADWRRVFRSRLNQWRKLV